MSKTTVIEAAAPIGDPARLKDCCTGLIDRLGTMEMPIDEKRIREAGGCVGGMLVGVMLGGTLEVPLAEASAVADLCAALKETLDDADERRLIAAVHVHACTARDSGTSLEVVFR